MATFTIRKTRAAQPVLVVIVLAYGCIKEELRTRTKLYTFGDDDTIAFILENEGIKYTMRQEA